MLDENKKIQWRNEATRFSQLRYPNINIGSFVMPHKHKIVLSTFVASKDKKRLTFVLDHFDFKGMCKFENIQNCVKIFNDRCEMIKDNYTFEKDISIAEPYEVNMI